MPTNVEIASRLIEIRTLMEMAGESFYKYMAYEKAAATVENAPPLADLIATGEHLALPGIGKSIGTVIESLVKTGTAEPLDVLHRRYPPTILELLGVAGIGTKSAAMLFEQFGIASLDDLERALRDGSLEGVPRLGPKTLDNWRRSLLAYKAHLVRTPLARARAIAREVMTFLAQGPPLHRLIPAGSLRRHEETVGDIDLVCTADVPDAVIGRFTSWERAEAVLAEGPTKASIWLASGLQIDLRVLPDHLYGNLLQHFTGSREHNIKLREYAVRKGLRVSENGIVDLATGAVTTAAEEAGVYERLGMDFIPPELRSGLDEIDLARRHALPKLVEIADLRGDFHMHTTWSDGRDDLEAMIDAVEARGYEYHAISDHSPGRGRFGLDPERVRKQRREIEALREKHGIFTLHASEVDIREDGALDYEDDVLAQFDLLIASVHSAFDQSREMMTKRLIRACENPYVTIIGHPTGRRFGEFEPYEFDYDAVFAAAARTGTALEIDGQAPRLDLSGTLARRAASFGAIFSLDSDAHRVERLDDVELALGQARRAGLTKDQVLNAKPLPELLEFIARKRSG
ncbi:MAG TPA: DNA polymerase/3'-5' exonuclease PolX [Candidatus Tyrphobacter sp.]